MNIKVGDVLRKEGGEERKVLAVLAEAYALSCPFRFDEFGYWYTETEIKKYFILPEKPWEPVEEQIYWSLDTDGIPWMSTWHNSHVDQNRRNFLGIFPTKEAAEARRDEIKKLLKK